jgi:hypothetical protein
MLSLSGLLAAAAHLSLRTPYLMLERKQPKTPETLPNVGYFAVDLFVAMATS